MNISEILVKEFYHCHEKLAKIAHNMFIIHPYCHEFIEFLLIELQDILNYSPCSLKLVWERS